MSNVAGDYHIFFCMFNPPYPVPIHFVRVAELDTWLIKMIKRIHDDAADA